MPYFHAGEEVVFIGKSASHYDARLRKNVYRVCIAFRNGDTAIVDESHLTYKEERPPHTNLRLLGDIHE